MKIRKYRFKNLPFKRSREVIYAESHKDERINDLIIRFLQFNDNMEESPRYDYLSKLFSTNGRVFWYISYLGTCLATNDVVNEDYQFTKAEIDKLRSIDNSWILNYLEDPSERDSFQPSILYWDDNKDIFDDSDDISVLNAINITYLKDWFDFYTLLLGLPKIHINDGIKYFNFPDVFYSDDENFMLAAYQYNKRPNLACAYSLSPENVSKWTKEANEMKNLLRRQKDKGVPFEIILSIVLEDRPSYPLHVSKDYNIYVDRIVSEELSQVCFIELPSIQKALYFLYLRHPEGISFKNLCDYHDELTLLYSAILGRPLKKSERTAIDSLIQGKESANQKRSKIKNIFKDILGEYTCDPYTISGEKGEVFKISLDRKYVTWECPDIERIPKDHVKQSPKLIKL